MDTVTVAILATVGGIGLFVSIITEVIIRAWKPTPEQSERFGPLIAIGLAIAFGVAGAAATGSDAFGGLLNGILAAGVGMGIHDTVSGPVAKTLS